MVHLKEMIRFSRTLMLATVVFVTSVVGIVHLLSMDFICLVPIAILIVMPVAGWLMNPWLDVFVYAIHIVVNVCDHRRDRYYPCTA